MFWKEMFEKKCLNVINGSLFSCSKIIKFSFFFSFCFHRLKSLLCSFSQSLFRGFREKKLFVSSLSLCFFCVLFFSLSRSFVGFERRSCSSKRKQLKLKFRRNSKRIAPKRRCIWVCVYVCVWVWVFTCVCLLMCLCVCVCVCVCVFVHDIV